MHNDWNKKREGIALVSFKDVEEVVILEEAHSSICYLKMKARNAFDQSFEDFRNIRLQFLNLAGLQDFDEFTNKHDFFGGICERPVLNQSVKQEKTKRWVFCQEEHGASHQMFMEKMAGLNFVKRNDHIFEENDVLFSEGNCKPRNDACQNIQQFRSSIELECLVYETVETIVDGFSDHLTTRDQLGIQAMQNVLEVFPLTRLFGIEQFQEFLNERRSNVNLQGFNVGTVVDNELKEEFVDRLKMRPSWI